MSYHGHNDGGLGLLYLAAFIVGVIKGFIESLKK